MTRCIGLAVVVLGVGACGSSSVAGIAGTPSSSASAGPGATLGATPGASGPASPGAAGGGGGGGAGMGAGGSGGAGTVGPDGNVVPSSDPSVTVTLGKACVVVGNAQTMHVQTYPGALLSYDTQYSGDKFGSTQGGKGSGQVDSTGSFDASWTVLPGTPNGVARIDVAANAGPNMSGFGHATFTVASSC